jgi:uncharacterized glyoxalase superfamily protein PhnB
MSAPSRPARLTDQASVLLARDVSAAVAYWVGQVGFETVGTWGEPPDFAILRRDGRFVMIGAAPAGHEIVPYWKTRTNLWNAYFWVDDAAALFAELKRRGAMIDYELCTQPYGVLEFGIQDLDGHDIGFGQVLKTAAEP